MTNVDDYIFQLYVNKENHIIATNYASVDYYLF